MLGTAALATYAILESRSAAQLKPGLPLPPRPLPEPLPIPPPPGAPQGAGVGQGVGTACDLGPAYPGFAWDGIECAPGETTPPGVYIVDDCSDFIYVDGDDGPQPDYLGDRILASAESVFESQNGFGVSYIPQTDPTTIVIEFLQTFWPQCTWPPSPDAPERIVQMFMALSVLVGRLIVDAGGNALGASTMQDVDEAVGNRLVELGFEYFTPEVVPEIDLSMAPDVEEPPLPPPADDGDGPDIDVPPPGPGYLDLPDGGVVPPSQQPGAQTPVCEEIAEIQTKMLITPEALWSSTNEASFKIWSPTSGQCDRYDIAIGVCMRSMSGFGILDAYVGDDPPPDAGEVFFRIRNVDQSGLEYEDWQKFRQTMVDKQQIRGKVQVLNNGKLQLVGPAGFQFTPINEASMDACPQRDERWPTPKAVFYQVMEQISLQWKNWRPIPQYSVKVQNDDLMLVVRYSGFPRFIRAPKNAAQPIDPQHDVGIVDRTKKTAFQLDVKVWSVGI